MDCQGKRRDKKKSRQSVMRWCIPACRCVFERLTSLPLFPLIPNLSLCVCFKAAVLPEQIIYRSFAVYSCFTETTMVSYAAVTSVASAEGKKHHHHSEIDFDASLSMLLYGGKHLFIFLYSNILRETTSGRKELSTFTQVLKCNFEVLIVL